MNRFKKILVAFDGSVDSINALKFAETLSKDQQAHLTVAYVHDQSLEGQSEEQASLQKDILSKTYVGPGPTPTRTISNNKNQRKKIKQSPDQVISSAKNTLSSGTNVTYEVLIGKPATEIEIYAKDNQTDLIVVGNRGFQGMKKFLMESVSQKVMNQATCSVLVIK